MKIALVNSFSEEAEGGGQSLITEELSCKLTQKGHECTVIKPGERAEAHILESGLIKYTVPSFGDVSVVLPILNDTNIKKLFKYLDNFKPQIVHIHNVALLETLVMSWAVRNKIPVIWTLHFLPSLAEVFVANDEQGKFPIYIKKAGVIDIWLNEFSKFCTSAIAINNSTGQEFKKIKFKGLQYKIPNGRDMKPLLDVKHRFPNKQEDVNLFYSGLISNRKNQEYLIEVLKYLPEKFQLTLVGHTEHDPKYYQRLQVKIEKYGLSNRVRFLGKVSYEKVVEELGKQHIFVSSSKVEVQSLSVLEALGAGVPIIGLANQTTSEVLNGDNGIVLPANTSADKFALEVENLAEDVERQKAISSNAKKTAARFDWEEVITTTELAYIDTIKRFKKPRKNELDKQLKNLEKFLDIDLSKLAKTLQNKGPLVKSNPMLWVLTAGAVFGSAFMLLNWKLINMNKKVKIKLKSKSVKS